MMRIRTSRTKLTTATVCQRPTATRANRVPAGEGKKAPAAKTGQATRPRIQSVLMLNTQKEKLSYALGMNLGTNLHKQTVEVDPAIVLRGLKDGLAAGKTLLSEDEARAALTQLQTEVRNKQQEKMKVAGELNKKERAEFLTSSKGNDGVVSL